MAHFEHYPQRTVTLSQGDEIRATYRQLRGAFNPSTLKRLFGWKEAMQYKGRVRHTRKGEGFTDSSLVVDFFDTKTNKRECTHVVYNVELQLAKSELYDLHYTPNPSPSLFDDER